MFSVYERIRHKIIRKLYPVLAPYRRKKINNTDFTIISNNCWGGICYEYFGLPKDSPTVGTYFFAKDYIKFISNLKYYLNTQIRIIKAEESKHYKSLKEKNELDVPIGVLDDVEIVFLHYRDPELAVQKWNRRIKRVNYDNIIIKFSYMNECNDEIISRFRKITGVKKICFIGGKGENTDDIIYLKEYESPNVIDDTFYWNRYIDIIKFINIPSTPYTDFKI